MPSSMEGAWRKTGGRLDVTGEEAFEVAAAVAAISGLAALLILCLLAIVGVWRLFERADDVSQASTRALVSIEDLTRRIAAVENMPLVEGDQFAQLRQQAETLLEQQRRLQDLAGSLLESGELEGGAPAALLEDLEQAVQRLDTTVGQMAASLANLIQLLERTERARG